MYWQVVHYNCVMMYVCMRDEYWVKTLCPEPFGEREAALTEFSLRRITLAEEWKVGCR